MRSKRETVEAALTDYDRLYPVSERGMAYECYAKEPCGGWICRRTGGHSGPHVAHQGPDDYLGSYVAWDANGILRDTRSYG